MLHLSCLFIADKQSTKMGLLQVFKDFAASTSIHGLTFLVQNQLSLGRRASWGLIFIAALIYAGRQLNISVICMFRLLMLIIPHLSRSRCKKVLQNTILIFTNGYLGKFKNLGNTIQQSTRPYKKWTFCVLTMSKQLISGLNYFIHFYQLFIIFTLPCYVLEQFFHSHLVLRIFHQKILAINQIPKNSNRVQKAFWWKNHSNKW